MRGLSELKMLESHAKFVRLGMSDLALWLGLPIGITGQLLVVIRFSIRISDHFSTSLVIAE